MKETFTGRVREAAQNLAVPQRWEFTLEQLYDQVDVRSYNEKRKVRSVIGDLCRAGEIEVVEIGRAHV